MSRREDLVEELNSSIEKLYRLFEREDEDMAIFLHQSINLNAGEETLEKILQDVKHHIDIRLKKQVKT